MKQGDPLRSPLFAHYQPLLEIITQAVNCVFSSLMDDTHIMGFMKEIVTTFDHLLTQLALVRLRIKMSAIVNQQPPMHQLAVLSTGWTTFFHSMSNGVHHNPFFFPLQTTVFIFLGFVLGCFFLGPNFTHSYPIHIPALISTVPTLVPY
jgi:hypothetical protein